MDAAVVGACCSWALTPLERQLGYLVKVGEKVEDLWRAMKNLKARSQDVTARIEEDQRIDPTRRPTNEVEEWLRSVHEIENEVNSIKASYEQIRCRCLGGCSANICLNWKIGRKATYELLRVNQVHQKGEAFDIVTRAGPPPPGQELPGTSNLVALDFNLKKVMDSLHAAASVADIKARTIGIYGMGGVGKTTLLKAVNNRLCSSGGGGGMAFEHVIWVVVSRNASVEKLQKDIMNFLKLSLQENANSMMRHDAIFNFLKNKKFIILLDDIWERLDLDEIGIPDRRLVLFTTRFDYVCGQMQAVKKIKVKCLQEKEAWQLFVDNVGEDVISASPEIKQLAEEVAKECDGLPLALTVLGRSMSSKHTPGEWRHTLATLKKPQPSTTKNIHEPVFRILKHSYDSLPDEETRKCFLFCALYREDYPFRIDELVKCFWGHELIDVKGCNNYGEIYDLVYDKVIGVLMSTCLLEVDDSWKPSMRVKMHDIIRDMALWIAHDCGGNEAKWIVHAGLKNEEPLKGVTGWEMAEMLSLEGNRITFLPMPKRRCEKLSTLNLESNSITGFPKGYFEFLPALKFLNLRCTRIVELPNELSSLIQLQYLDLSYTFIESLSINLRNLRKLTHLVLRECGRLKYVPYGLISCLPQLEFLDMYNCFQFNFSSEIFTREQKEKSLCVEDHSEKKQSESQGAHKCVSNDVVPPKAHLEELKILKERQQMKYISLVKKMGTISDLLNVVDAPSVCELRLEELEDSNPQEFIVNLMKLSNSIEGLDLISCGELEELILTREQVGHERGLNDHNWCFIKLHHLFLADINKLHKITWTKYMFPRLEYLTISSCPSLQNLTWTGLLPCLHYLSVSYCHGLEELISVDEGDEGPSRWSSSILLNLHSLTLFDLSNLNSISKAILDTPKLSELEVLGCPKLKRLPFNFEQQMAEKRVIRLQFGINNEWWNDLEWDDITVKSYLDHFRK